MTGKGNREDNRVGIKRVAILHYAGPPIVGGVESTIYHHARLLVENGFEVDVIAGKGDRFHPKVNYHAIPEVDSRNTLVLTVGKSLAAGEVTHEFEMLYQSLVNQLSPILEAVDVCIVHNVITLHKNLALTSALRTLADEEVTSFIAWCHDFAWQDSLYQSELHPGHPWNLLRSAWPGVRYVVVSAHRRSRLARLLDLPESEIEVITPGVDVNQFLKLEPLTQELVKKLGLLYTDPLMYLPARITRRKNIEFAIRVIGYLVRHKPKGALIVTGPPGPHNPKNISYLASLKELAENLGVSGQVHLLYEHGENGNPLHLPDEVIADFYHLADVLIFPSRREGFGIPVLEAGLSRLPVFAADIPSIRESGGQFIHRFDPDGDPKLVADAIVSHLEQDRNYQLKHRVVNNYSWDAIVKKRIIPFLGKPLKVIRK